MKIFRWIGAIICQIIAYGIGTAAAVGVFFGAAKIHDNPFLLILLALFAASIVFFLFSWLAAKLFDYDRREKYAGLQALGSSLLLFVAIWIFVLQPLIPASEQYVRTVPANVEYWQLPTGSRIAVRKIWAQSSEKKTPIIVLHGGPGSYSVGLEQTWRALSVLALDGYVVYFYDQIGGGLSDRLADISLYSLDRHIADLHAIYEKIDADQVILIGSSFGATLASNYMAKYPEHVSHAIFSGVGPMYLPDWPDGADGGLDDRMMRIEKVAFDKAIGKPRLMAAIILADINPTAAERFFPAREAGSFYDQIANDHYLPFVVCDQENVTTKTQGLGFWSNRMTGKSLKYRTDDPKPILRENKTPVLVLRGECDYKSKDVAKQYSMVFPNATLSTFKDAGHMFYWEKPEVFVSEISRFLNE